MKVVLFCGGLGMRLRDYSETIPKPMVTIGYRPILWHVMKYYAHFGHKEFIPCLGYGASHIKNYFLTYQEAASNDFKMQGGRVELMSVEDLLASERRAQGGGRPEEDDRADHREVGEDGVGGAEGPALAGRRRSR